MNIEIIEDKCVNMLQINVDISGKMVNIFHGNTWDFERDGYTFKKLFVKLGHIVNLTQICEEDEEI